MSKLSTPLVRIDLDGRIQVYIHTSSFGEFELSELRAHEVEVEIENKDFAVVQGWAPFDRIEEISALPFVRLVAHPSYGTSRAGSINTEGDSILNADKVRQLGFDGSGVKVGVISDGAINRAAAQASGDLPANISVFGACTPRAFDGPSCLSEKTCDEGTAMLEIIHDIAPGAELAVASANTSLEFIQRVNELVDNFGADIIVDDLGFFGEPYFADGLIAQGVAAVADRVVYISSAGNRGRSHYEADYSSTFFQDLNVHDFGQVDGGGTDAHMDVVIEPGEFIFTILQWNDPFGASANDYDMLLGNQDETELLCESCASFGEQSGSQDPIEAICYFNDKSIPVRGKLLVTQFSGANRRIELFALGGGSMEEYDTPTGGVFGHPGLSDVLAVGAIDAADPGNDTIEPYSSRGPSRVDFPGLEIRQKPDLAAIDGVSVTGAGGFASIFFGTSASAPHVAGIAALLKQAAPERTPEAIRSVLTGTAIDLGTPGPDDTYGSGRVDAFAAFDSLRSDVSVSSHDSIDPVGAGTMLSYVILIENAGPTTAKDVVVDNVLPDGAGFVDATGDGWSCINSDGTVSCTRDSVAVGPAPFILLNVAAPAGLGTVSNTTTVSTSTLDSNVDNNVVTEPTSVVPAVLTFIAPTTEEDSGNAGLDEPRAVTVSPDGAHVYIASFVDDAVAVFRRNQTTGVLDFVEMQKDGRGNVDGLDGATSVAVSPDSAHVYVVGQFDDSLVTFNRDAATGALEFINVHWDGVAGVDGLDGAQGVIVSPDGKHVYVASASPENAVAVFSRNLSTGILTFVAVYKDGVDGVDGLDNALSLTVSPDGKHIYVTGHLDSALAVFERDAATGSLGFVEAVKNGTNGVQGIQGAISVSVSTDGSHVYASGFNSSAVAVFDRDAITGALTFVEVHKDGVAGVDGLDRSRSVALSPDGLTLYVASGFPDHAVASFERDPATGKLTFAEALKDNLVPFDGLNGANAVTVSPDGHHTYVTSAEDDAVVVFARGDPGGRLTFVEVQKNGSGLDGVTAIRTTASGTHIYTASGRDHSIGVFARDAGTGTLSFVQAQTQGISGIPDTFAPIDLVISPDDAHAYVAAYFEDAVLLYGRDSGTGKLNFEQSWADGEGGIDGLSGASAVAVSPDGAHVYVIGTLESALAVFGRDAATGALSFLEFHKDGVAGVDGLDRPQMVIVSPDGANLYVASSFDDSIAVFARNQMTGLLNFVEVHKDGVNGIEGLDRAESVAVSPDGAHVYATGGGDDTVLVFLRNAQTGALSFLELHENGIGGLDFASSVAVSPDGAYVFATGGIDDALVVFKRNAATGRLKLMEWYKNGAGGVIGLDGATASIASPAGDFLYVAGSNSNAVAIFRYDDIDGDGRSGVADNCPNNSNQGQQDTDKDGIGNACDNDDDGDGMTDAYESANGLNSQDAGDADLDKDLDGLSNFEEFLLGTRANVSDSDGDGLSDGEEVAAHRSPLINEAAVLQIINSILLNDE